MKVTWLAAPLLFVGAMLVAAPHLGAAVSDDVTRGQYIRSVEPVCAKDARQNARILGGVRQEIARGQYARAARKFRRATHAFTGTLKQVLAVPRPRADNQILVQWLTKMIKQRGYLVQITKTLQQRSGFRAQRMSVYLFRNARQANQIVSDYGFQHCILEPARFM